MALMASGDAAAAVHDSSEAFRLVQKLQASEHSSGSYVIEYWSPEPQEQALWRVRALHLASLAQLGHIWELLGCSESALTHLSEGKQMVSKHQLC